MFTENVRYCQVRFYCHRRRPECGSIVDMKDAFYRRWWRPKLKKFSSLMTRNPLRKRHSSRGSYDVYRSVQLW